MTDTSLGAISTSLVLDTSPFINSVASIKEAARKMCDSFTAVTKSCSELHSSTESIAASFRNAATSLNSLSQASGNIANTFQQTTKEVNSLYNNITPLASSIHGLVGNIEKLGLSAAQSTSPIISLKQSSMETLNVIANLCEVMGFLGKSSIGASGGIAKTLTELGGLGLSLSRFGPIAIKVGLIIAALAAAIWGLSAAYKACDPVKQAEKHKQAAQAKYEEMKSTKALIDEYEVLKGKVNRSNTETERMHDLLQRIARQNPELISGFNSHCKALGLNAQAARQYAVELRRAYLEAVRLESVSSIKRQEKLEGDLIHAQNKMSKAERQKAYYHGLQHPTKEAQLLSVGPSYGGYAQKSYAADEKAAIGVYQDAEQEAKQIKKRIDREKHIQKVNRKGYLIADFEQPLPILPDFGGGSSGIPTNTYRVPSVTTPSYKTPPPTVDEKADKVMGNLSNARELLDSGAQNLSKWMKGLSVEEHIRRLTQIANGEGQWAKVSIEIRKRAADQIQQLRDRQAQEEEKAIQNHIRLLGEEYAQGKISNEKYIEELKKIAAQKETYQNAGIETARAAAAKIEEIERQNMENRLIIARSLGNEEEVIEIERQQRMEALTRGGMKKEDAETVAKSEADSKLENIFTAKQSQEMEQKDWDKAHGKVSQDEYITFLKTKRNESEQWAKDHGQDSKNNRNYRTVTGKLEDAYNEQARGKIDAAIDENGKNTEALKQALLLLKEEYSALGDAGIKAFDTVNAKIKEFNTGIVESTTTLDNAQDKTASWANVQENAFDGMLTNIGSGLSNAIVDWMQGINSFGDFMKNLWKQVLNTIVNSIVQQVLSSNKYLKGLFSGASGGKGGFLSGLLGSIPGIGGILGGIAGIFGFDSPTNDTTASRYGADFARIFRQGAEDELGRALAPSAQASSSSPVVHNNNQQVTVSTSVDQVTGITDIERISETQAWIIGQRLGLAPTTG